MNLQDEAAAILKEKGFELEKLYDYEPDPGLGNGGLGRLAACYMDALTSQDYLAEGFCIRYEYGLFKQNRRRMAKRNAGCLVARWRRVAVVSKRFFF